MAKLYKYLVEIRDEVLPKSPAAKAVRYALNQLEALSRFLEDGDLEIDNGATERANRDIAIGRGNWTFFGSDNGGKIAAVLLSFIAMCTRDAVEPFAWVRNVLSRIATYPVHRLAEIAPAITGSLTTLLRRPDIRSTCSGTADAKRFTRPLRRLHTWSGRTSNAIQALRPVEVGW
jgi:hypothetical protein